MGKTLRLVLGDQLNISHPWFSSGPDASVTYVLMEVRQETDYAPHHVQKVLAFFLAMRAFAEELRQAGHTVRYFPLDDPENRQTLGDNLQWMIALGDFDRFEYLAPDEYRLDLYLREFAAGLSIPSSMEDTAHFLTHRQELAEMFRGKKTYLMETFYRNMRRKHGVLMEANGDPLTGKWNYDAENRARYDDKAPIPTPWIYPQQVGELLAMLEKAGVKTIGTVDAEAFIWPVTRTQALDALEQFVQKGLPHFGQYQDAMTDRHWSLFHSRLSFPLNVKLLHPLEVVNRAIREWEQRPEEIPFSALEGFVRQIVGWREYMRGVYWAHMPEYALKNYFGHDRKLPGFFWTGKTHMRCMQHAIGQSLEYAYAHHIQRLMVTGNFALLAGIDPAEVDSWYLGIYIDAIEWVEITNTRGMSQFADGGLVGTKPYVSTANYMDKMSDYCGGCHYDKKKRHGERACPFNSLYWHFYARHEDKLAPNPRIGYAYQTLRKMDPAERAATLAQAEAYLEGIEGL